MPQQRHSLCTNLKVRFCLKTCSRKSVPRCGYTNERMYENEQIIKTCGNYIRYVVINPAWKCHKENGFIKNCQRKQ